MGGNEIDAKQATLAAILLQIANVVFTGGTGVEVHLACAMHFLRDLDYITKPIDQFLPRLLVQRFAMLDVITSIQRRRRPQLGLDFWLFTPDEYFDRSQPSFREMTGCPQPVLCFLARVSDLCVDVAEKCKREFEIVDEAATLETDMRIYARSAATFNSSRTRDASHLDTLSECFYWSAHLLLQRRVYRDPTSTPRVQHAASNIVRLIKSMPIGCGLDSSVLFPFYVSSKEAITEEHRNWIRQRNEEMKRVYPARSRDALMLLLNDMWAAVDAVRQQKDVENNSADTMCDDLEDRREVCLF